MKVSTPGLNECAASLLTIPDGTVLDPANEKGCISELQFGAELLHAETQSQHHCNLV
jgi:hypothetical protein